MRKKTASKKKRMIYLTIGLMTGLISGCGVKTDDSVVETAKLQEKENLSTATQPDRDIDIDMESLEQQIQVIIDNEKLWKYDYREQEDEYSTTIYQGAVNYDYMICDLDQNGRVEIFCQTYQGNGHYPTNDYFEVNTEQDGLNHISFDAKSEDRENDFADYAECCAVYYDESADIYHYALRDWRHSSAIDHSEAELDVVLQDGVLCEEEYCYWKQKRTNGKDTGKKQTLGWEYSFYDQGRQKISAQEWYAFSRDYFQPMTERLAVFQWFQTVDTDDNYDAVPITDQELAQRMKKSYQNFGFIRADSSKLSYDDQIQLIAKQKEVWIPWLNGSKQVDIEPESYSFLINDLDHNGRLEVFVSFMGGSGGISENTYYEVDEENKGLVEITPETEHQTDWLGTEPDQYMVYYTTFDDDYDYEDRITHYSVGDGTWGGAGNGEYISQDLYLLDGELCVTNFAMKKLEEGKCTYYRLENGIQTRITKKQYRKLQYQHFLTLPENTVEGDGVIFHWFSLPEHLSEKELTETLETAYMNWAYNSDKRY